jgi:hypothetical protein
MKKIVLTFGLISGAVMSLMLGLTVPLHDKVGFDKGMVIGYTSMVVAGLLIYFGVKSYRDNVGGGVVSFGRAFVVGMLISTVASVCYVATWQAIYFGGYGEEFSAKYQAYMIEKERSKGTSQAELDAKVAEMRKWAELYRNPAFNAAITFLEPLPVGLALALISAGLLRRKFAAAPI